ncbi:hypothetical protein [Pseudomonas sp.]|uniref:hypothetical protein n=1 Tax=Pseudomonas sp. TaxID=306 RepID=UPI0028AE551B|nr:hypothetical protein [Pseudomonas sp.]
MNLIYEKMYAYEERIKENISIKVQLLFTAIFLLVSVTVYLARFLDFSIKPGVAYVIVVFIVLVLMMTAISAYFNCKAFSGSEFNRMPYATKIQEYYEGQVQYNKEVEIYNASVSEDEAFTLIDPKNETEAFIGRALSACATHNALVNEKRSRLVFKAFVCCLLSCVPLVLASFIFVAYDMDTSSPRKEFSIRDRHVAAQLARLTEEVAARSASSTVTALENRTTLLEQALIHKPDETMTKPEKADAAESKPKPEPPTKPSAPLSRMTYDDASGASSRSSK